VSTRGLTIGIAVAMIVALAGPGAAVAAPDRTFTVTTANAGANPVKWDGPVASGTNTNYDSTSGEPCGKTQGTYCDVTLLKVEIPGASLANLELDVFNYRPNPTSDFDVYIYESDATGKRGKLVELSGEPPAIPEFISTPVKSGYFLVQVVYFAVVQSQYTAEVRLADLVPRLADPLDVDEPPGLQEYLASNPAFEFKSHSEPHIAQSPTNPDILVGGSKMYNRDRDALDEYEFLIGTYVSFDRGITWTDLGQLAVCPPSQAPQSSFPVNNTCYPEEDPNKGGTGPEDVKDSPEDTSFDDRGSGDYAEEYTTSDVWLQFDDEGNAYVMVLDHAPLGLEEIPVDPFATHEDGWGMSMHKWESVSPADVASGRTWGPRVPINYYSDELRQRLFLDDKNTMAVNNAGPDGDGNSGTIIACWGRTAQPAKQTIVCDRSTDGGKTFPGDPIPVSEPQNLVIGIHVIADPQNENTFHLMWNYYVIAASPYNQMYYARTTNAGQTWTPPIPVGAPFESIPRQYPSQKFRNLSLPIMAAAPNGELYATWADYRAAPDPATDADDAQADIVFTKSTNGGNTWSAPTVVNQDKTNADQFQPYIAVTPQGELQIAYFDRRHDVRQTSGGQVTHEGNFYVDEYLSRSTDGGATWKDTRLSHDMSDPEVNAPTDSSGAAFFGDYQGLVADDCFTIPFFQDAHLSEDPARDPEFDDGLPRSKYQEAFAWIVPNAKQTGECRLRQRQAPDRPTTPGGLPNVTVTAPRLASDRSNSNRFNVRINATAAGIDFYQLQYRRLRSGRWRTASSKLLAANYAFRGAYASTYEFRARAIDLAGREGPWSRSAVTIIPHDDRRSQGRPRYAGRWSAPKNRSAFGGSLHRSTRKGSTMRINFRGSRVYLVGRVGPSGGRAVAIVNGKRRRISFYSRKARNRHVVFSRSTPANRMNTLQVTVLGQKGSRKSKGSVVEIDAIGYRGR
jgi:hypothetical protein